MTIGKAFYAKQGDTCVLKFVGNIRYTMGYSLDEFTDQLLGQGDFEEILIDLTEANSIDSTSLGVLAKIANFMRERFARKPILFSSNADINQTLGSLGFDQIFLISENRTLTVDTEKQITFKDPDKTALAKTLLKAHRILSELNDQNREKFKDVIELLEDTISKKNQ